MTQFQTASYYLQIWHKSGSNTSKNITRLGDIRIMRRHGGINILASRKYENSKSVVTSFSYTS